MGKNYYYVHYSNVNVEGEHILSWYYYNYGFSGAYFVKEFKQEVCYREKEVRNFWGTKK